MRVSICAVGRMKHGPERLMVEDYLDRFNKTGRALGLGPCDLHEVEDKRGGGMAAEAQLLRSTTPKGASVICLDERGKQLSSPDFAHLLAQFRDQGQAPLAFVIGGADGIDPVLRSEATQSISFGAMVWPHMLARVMLTEQLYRAATILAGGPYHRA